MKTFVAVSCALFSLAFAAHAQDSFTASGSTVSFTRPDPAQWKLTHNGVDEKTKRYVVMFEHEPIQDAEGRPISPVIAILCESVPESLNVIQYSKQLRERKPFTVNKMLSHTDGSLSYQNSVGYEGEYDSGIVHKVLVGHLRNGTAGVQVICDSTNGVYDKVEADMRSFLRSVTFGGQPAKPGVGPEPAKDR